MSDTPDVAGHEWEREESGEPVNYDGWIDFHDILVKCVLCEMTFCKSCVSAYPESVCPCEGPEQ